MHQPELEYILKWNRLSLILPSDSNYDVLCKTLKDHYRPEPILVAERYKFYKINQKENDTIIKFIIAIKKLSFVNENVNVVNFLDQALCDLRIVK